MKKMMLAAACAACLAAGPVYGDSGYDSDYWYDCRRSFPDSTIERWYDYVAAFFGSVKAKFSLGCYYAGPTPLKAWTFWKDLYLSPEYLGRAYYVMADNSRILSHKRYEYYYFCNSIDFYGCYEKAADYGNVGAICEIVSGYYTGDYLGAEYIHKNLPDGSDIFAWNKELDKRIYADMMKKLNLASKLNQEQIRQGVLGSSRTGFDRCPKIIGTTFDEWQKQRDYRRRAKLEAQQEQCYKQRSYWQNSCNNGDTEACKNLQFQKERNPYCF